MTHLPIFLLAALALLAGCATPAHYRVAPPLAHYDPGYGYRMENAGDPDNSDGLLIVMSFSGGGTRAAALAYGALQQLAATPIRWQGRDRRLLDEVDIIHSVSGGSFTAAYYALHGDRIFEDFETRFLRRDFETAIQDRMLANLGRLRSPRFGRIDVVAEHLDETLYDGRTYADLMARGRRPFVVVNATDMSAGTQFAFTQDQFDLLCADLAHYPVSRAVAASAAVPLLFSPVTLWNFAGQCRYEMPAWLRQALASPATSGREAERARQTASYLDAKARPYIHLLDGGLVDNVGLRGPLEAALLRGGLTPALRASGFRDIRKFAIIAVNAETEPDLDADASADVPTLTRVSKALVDIPINRNSFETAELLRTLVTRLREEARSPAARGVFAPDARIYLVEVSLAGIADRTERDAFMRIPTSLVLTPEQVDKLKAVAGRLMRESPEFQRLARDLAP